jgi:hypothetical protein
MTRREEITKKALELDTTNDIATFVVAAKWADKTMIEKACEYLKNALYEVASGVTNSFDIMSIENTTMDDFISSFRNAMLEEE